MHIYIADFANVSMESAVKLLKSFEKDKLIKLDGKQIEIVNLKAMQELSIKG